MIRNPLLAAKAVDRQQGHIFVSKIETVPPRPKTLPLSTDYSKTLHSQELYYFCSKMIIKFFHDLFLMIFIAFYLPSLSSYDHIC